MARAEEKKRPNHLGFLTTLGDPDRGLIGGFLVLNAVGRPTEFHCTAPVRANRAQRILYGNTLEGFVCGEQIARALVDRTKTELAAILTNNPNILLARDSLKAPLTFVFQRSNAPLPENEKEKYAVWNGDEKNNGRKNGEDGDENNGENVPNGAPTSERTLFYRSFADIPFVPGLDFAEWRETAKGKNRLALPIKFAPSDAAAVSFDELSARLDIFLKSIDAVEPFERIRLAVEEAQKSA